MTTQTTGKIRPKSNTSHADKDFPLVVSCFRVVTDSEMPDGTRHLQCGLSPNFKTIDEARAFKDRCEIDGAYIVQNSIFCRDEAERDDLAHHIFEVVAA